MCAMRSNWTWICKQTYTPPPHTHTPPTTPTHPPYTPHPHHTHPQCLTPSHTPTPIAPLVTNFYPAHLHSNVGTISMPFYFKLIDLLLLIFFLQRPFCFQMMSTKKETNTLKYSQRGQRCHYSVEIILFQYPFLYHPNLMWWTTVYSLKREMSGVIFSYIFRHV